jgi:glutathione-regulated potassium-efflux system ancillary protein KefC
MDQHGLLVSAAVYLGAAVLAVPLLTWARLGPVLGYLVAGVAIGPWGLGAVRDVEHILHVSELGVILLLFVIGLELNPQRLRAMRRPLLVLGGAQVLVTALLLGATGVLLGLDWRAAVVVGMGLALSSTAVALQGLSERNLLPTAGGSASLSVLLFQDVAVVPMLALVPLLGGTPAAAEAQPGWIGALHMVAVVAGILVGGNLLLVHLFRLVAATRVREVFTAFSLLLVVCTALLMDAVGLSMALGTFLAGVLLAESEYRHAVESDIEPFKGLLLGLFFISIGMSLDVGLILRDPALFAALVAGLVVLKGVVLLLLARLYGLPAPQVPLFVIVLAQGGEFAFVLFGVAAAGGALDPELARLLTGVVALSMVATPLLLALGERVLEPRRGAGRMAPADPVADPGHPVIVAGFGRFGQTVARLLHANGVETTILDHDPDHFEDLRRLGFKVFYGDAGRLDLLRAAGAERARLLVVAVDDRDQALHVVDVARAHFPRLTIVSRARDMAHTFELRDRGVADFERETFESALRLGEAGLRRLGFTAWRARQAANRYRAHDRRVLAELYRHFQSELDVRAAISLKARERLREEVRDDEARPGPASDGEWP